VSFAAIALCVAFQRVFVVVYFVMTHSGKFWIYSRIFLRASLLLLLLLLLLLYCSNPSTNIILTTDPDGTNTTKLCCDKAETKEPYGTSRYFSVHNFAVYCAFWLRYNLQTAIQ
jgi:hypothetical protein